MGTIRWLVLGGVALVACVSTGMAHEGSEGEAGRRVSFRVEAAREVPNDWFTALVGITAEDPDPAVAAARVNEAMSWGLERARAASAVSARSGSYRTQPVQHEGRIRRWRASHELLLESADAEALTALLGTLQQKLQLQSFTVGLSEARRAAVEQELVGEAIAAFQARADLVQRSLGRRGHTIDQLSIETDGRGPVPMLQMERGMMASAMAPAVESGTSRIVVGVHATIVLE